MTIYMVVAIDGNGRSRCAWLSTPKVPDDYVRPGEMAFVLEPLDSRGRHMHSVGADDE